MGKISKAVKNTLRPSPFHYVMMLAAVLFLLSFGLRLYFQMGETRLDVRFRDRAAERASAPAVGDISGKIYFGDDDRSARYAERLRDASQIAISLGLYTVRERTGPSRRVIPDIVEVMEGLEKSDLRPAVVRTMKVQKTPSGDARGVFLTEGGAYYVSYRPRPLAFEILASGDRGLADGAIFVVRLPEVTGTITRAANAAPQPGAYATVFVAPYANARVPLAFSPPDVYRMAGWGQEPLRAAPVSQAQLSEINRFLGEVAEESGR